MQQNFSAGMNEPSKDGCTLNRVRSVKADAHGTFSRLASVVGIGITRVGAGYGLKINLHAAPDGTVTLPADIQGVPVRVEIVGAIRKQKVAE